MIPRLTCWVESLCTRLPWLAAIYKLYYRRLLNREVALAQIKPLHRVLCIGAGPLPVTAMEIARRCGARVTAIDICPRAVRLGRKAVAKQGLDGQVDIRYGDGRKICPRGYDFIHIARQVCPQQCVLDNILPSASSATRIMVRTPHPCLEALYGKQALSGGTLLLKGERHEKAGVGSNRRGLDRSAAVVG